MGNFLDWPYVKRIELLLAVVGIILTLYHVWEGVFAEGRSLSASYKTELLAEGNGSFQLSSFVRQDLVQANRIVDVSVILWNSGREIISNNDIRGDEHVLTIELDLGDSSSLMENGWRTGNQKASTPKNFDELQRRDRNSFTFSWKAMDPGDFYQAHFLVATKLDVSELGKIGVRLGGSVTGTRGNVAVNVSPYRTTREMRVNLAALLWMVLFIGAVRGVFPLVPSRQISQSKFPRAGLILGLAAVLVATLACMGIAGIIAGAIAEYYVGIPDWTSLSFQSFFGGLKPSAY